MSKASNEVVYARMHTTIFAPSIGQMGPELNSTASAQHKAVEMTLEDGYVECKVLNKGKPVTVVIPLANFTNLVMK